MPNFDQFVEFVLNPVPAYEEHNAHLDYFWHKCDMCRIHYDIIGKVESSSVDINYIFDKVCI